jgi:ADP-ribose pyrophosphatase
MNFKVKESNKIFSGRVFDIKVDNIIYESGNEDVREVIIHNGGAVVLPITDEGKIVLVKQYRYPFDEFMLELPAGKLELGEDPRRCAIRELNEETGYTSDKVNLLGRIYTSPGFCTEILYIYSANNLRSGDHNRDEGEEGMKVCEISLNEVNDLITEGEIVDAKTISGIYYYSLSLNR